MTGQWWCPECGAQMFFHIDADALICARCGYIEPAEIL